MAIPRYLNVVSGKLRQVLATVTSSPEAIVSTDINGKIDVSILPVGVGAEVIVVKVITGINLAAGDFVNIYREPGGAGAARRAEATAGNNLPAHGFVLTGVTGSASATATVYLVSQTNTSVTGLTIGADYFLDPSGPGKLTVTPPTGAGQIVQYIGTPDRDNSIVFINGPVITLA